MCGSGKRTITPLMRALGFAHYWQRLLDEQLSCPYPAI